MNPASPNAPLHTPRCSGEPHVALRFCRLPPRYAVCPPSEGDRLADGGWTVWLKSFDPESATKPLGMAFPAHQVLPDHLDWGGDDGGRTPEQIPWPSGALGA
jgi:hypothetical protein